MYFSSKNKMYDRNSIIYCKLTRCVFLEKIQDLWDETRVVDMKLNKQQKEKTYTYIELIFKFKAYISFERNSFFSPDSEYFLEYMFSLCAPVSVKSRYKYIFFASSLHTHTAKENWLPYYLYYVEKESLLYFIMETAPHKALTMFIYGVRYTK